MKIEPLALADFDLVEVKTTNECKPTPHCKNHGAMNKITADGIWRCISVTGFESVIQDGSKQKGNHSSAEIHKETICRAGCSEIND